PLEDSEFDVPVPGKERQTTQYSPADGKMDLLTVVMRELGLIYLQGKPSLTKEQRKNLEPLMESTLSPGVRRMPLDQWRLTARFKSPTQQNNESKVASNASSPSSTGASSAESKVDSSAPSRSTPLLDLKPAVYNPSGTVRPGFYGSGAKRMTYAPNAKPSP